MDELLAQPTRRRIYEVVGEHPGSSARDVQRHAGLAWGETAYHLDQLTRSGALRRERGGRRDYYFRADMTWEDRKLLRSLRSSTQRRLLVVLLQEPGLTVAEASARTLVGISTAAFHLRALLAAGLIETFRDGNLRRFRPVRPERLRALIRSYRESLRDRVVDRFVDTWSSLLR